MEAIQSHYHNGTAFTVKVKDKAGNIYTVKPNKGIVSKMMCPYVKIKYPNTGWRKF